MNELGKKIGSFVSGSFVKLILRQKSDHQFELGELFVAGNSKDNYSIFQIKDLMYGSQISDPSLELMAGYGLERPESDLKVYEHELRNYVLAQARELITVKNKMLSIPKKLPQFFSNVYELEREHLNFFKDEVLESPLRLGEIRSGSKVLAIDVNVDAIEVLKHHILIPATTGRGKSNLVKTILYDIMENTKVGKLIFDPHNEYYGTINQKGLRDHPKSQDFLQFYTARQISGAFNLKFNFKLLNPGHVLSSIELTDAQKQGIVVFYRTFREEWVHEIYNDYTEQRKEQLGVHPQTVEVLRRKIGLLLHLMIDKEAEIQENGIYTQDGHEQILHDIYTALSHGKTVIVDTSLFDGAEEIFIASIIVEHIFNQYKRLKFKDQLQNQPVITIVIEEAPRVIGKKVLEKIDNVFGKIAREGRKFQIGLIAITQLPSIIDREILANMNTKIIMGNEMGPERRAIIESAAQDLSDDYQNIGSLDKGEAIVTSNFTKFAIPIKIPLFDDVVTSKNKKKENSIKVKKKSPGFD